MPNICKWQDAIDSRGWSNPVWLGEQLTENVLRTVYALCWTAKRCRPIHSTFYLCLFLFLLDFGHQSNFAENFIYSAQYTPPSVRRSFLSVSLTFWRKYCPCRPCTMDENMATINKRRTNKFCRWWIECWCFVDAKREQKFGMAHRPATTHHVLLCCIMCALEMTRHSNRPIIYLPKCRVLGVRRACTTHTGWEEPIEDV